jgi:beta-lactamase regulating signal transducer with metallopeptidase domain
MTSLAALIGALFLKPAVVLAAGALVAAGLRRQPAATRHAVWTMTIGAILALPLLASLVPSIHVPLFPAAVASSLPRDAASPAARRAATASGSFEARMRAQSASGVSVREADSPQARVAAPKLFPGVLAVWLLGAVLIGVRGVASHVRARRIVRRATQTSTPEHELLLIEVARASGIRRPVELRVTGEITSPAIVGVRRPVLLVPRSAERWPETDMRAVFVHELGHVARRDSLINVAAEIAIAVYWCNPAVWFAVRRLRAESERACDDRVLLTSAEPDRYARLLLRIVRTARFAGSLPGAATAMARPSELESRLVAVLDPQIRRGALTRRMGIAFGGAGVAIAASTAALTLAAPPRPSAAEARDRSRAPAEQQRADSVASPESERVPFTVDASALARATRTLLAGPDSLLAKRLVVGLGRQPRHEGDLVSARAAWALMQAKDGRLTEPLIDALDARDWRVQTYAAWALALTSSSRAAERMVPLLDHPVWRLRAMVAHALSEARDPRAEGAMDGALADPAWQVRVEAVEYFSRLGGPRLAERLRPLLADRHVAVRLAAEQTLTPR